MLPDSSVRLNKYISEAEFAHAAKRIAISSKAMCSLMASEPPLAIR